MPWNDDASWESRAPMPWEQPLDESAWATSGAEDWRGDVHLGDWPEELGDAESWLRPTDETDANDEG